MQDTVLLACLALKRIGPWDQHRRADTQCTAKCCCVHCHKYVLRSVELGVDTVMCACVPAGLDVQHPRRHCDRCDGAQCSCAGQSEAAAPAAAADNPGGESRGQCGSVCGAGGLRLCQLALQLIDQSPGLLDMQFASVPCHALCSCFVFMLCVHALCSCFVFMLPG
jgi:hypothetical protein